jgi:predicted enzyme related to lactoylglutathione lyase
MEKVTGIGGFFFRAANPADLAAWYERHLGINPVPKTAEAEPWTQEAGTTAFSPFKADSTYFGDPAKNWMLNFRVRDMNAMVEQLRRAGIEVSEPVPYEGLGVFAKLKDPEGNPIELWEPPPP